MNKLIEYINEMHMPGIKVPIPKVVITPKQFVDRLVMEGRLEISEDGCVWLLHRHE